MGKINQGILGGFSGKVGNVIGGNWKGIDYMRVKPASVANPRTEGQLDQRSKFSTVLKFLQPMKDFIKVGYKGYANQMTEFNSAMSYNLKNAVTGTYPDYEIDYANSLISRGGLASALNGAATSALAGRIEFTWDNNSDAGNASMTDKAYVLAYNKVKNEVVYSLSTATRMVGRHTLTVPDSWSGDDVEGFISFTTFIGDENSNSKYIGSVTIS